MTDLFAVVPEYSYGPDVPGIELIDDKQRAVEAADIRQREADRWGMPVVLRVYELTEVER